MDLELNNPQRLISHKKPNQPLFYEKYEVLNSGMVEGEKYIGANFN